DFLAAELPLPGRRRRAPLARQPRSVEGPVQLPVTGQSRFVAWTVARIPSQIRPATVSCLRISWFKTNRRFSGRTFAPVLQQMAPPFGAREFAARVRRKRVDEHPLAWHLPGRQFRQQKLLQSIGGRARSHHHTRYNDFRAFSSL